MEENEKSFELIETKDAIELVPKGGIEAWWYVAAAALVMGLALLLIRQMRKKAISDPDREKREAYAAAKSELQNASCVYPRDAAILVSAALRRYLARSMGEPALFESHEEFLSRHDALKVLPGDVRGSVSGFFTRLAELKYGSEQPDADPDELLAEASQLLERIHTA